MLKNRDLFEVPTLYELSSHPEVFPYIRQKTNSVDEFYFSTKQIIEAENQGELISRTIIDEYLQPIGTISLYDIQNNAGFLATWLGRPYFGKGYNQMAKLAFLQELFLHQRIENVFMKIRKTNQRSLHAITKIPYVLPVNTMYAEIYQQINQTEEIYDLLVIAKEQFLAHHQFVVIGNQNASVEVDIVS